jgi:hypothetical protein
LDGSGGTTVPDSFNPDGNRALSDFDVRHNFNAHWVVDIPVASGIGPALDQLVGGWGLTGAWRWRSGLPLNPGGINRVFNLFTRPPATVTAPLVDEVTRNGSGGVPNLFADPAAERAKIGYTLPGSSGSRNAIPGPGYFSLDLGVHKSFQLPWQEGHRIQFRWDTFNVFNNVNFASTSIDLVPTSPTFGAIRATAGSRGGSREMEFALRYEF